MKSHEIQATLYHLAASGADSDGDGVEDTADNCPPDLERRPTDFDADGMGDVCDDDDDDDGTMRMRLPDGTETIDTDGDGVGDNADAFPADSAESMDSDGDGVVVNADALPLGTCRINRYRRRRHG